MDRLCIRLVFAITIINSSFALAEPTAVTLAQVLEHAEEHSPELRVAEARLRRREVGFAAADPILPSNPELSLSAGPRLTEAGRGTDFGAGVGQRIEIAGERGLRRTLAQRRAETLEAELAEARWQVHHAVHAAFHEALVERERSALVQRIRIFQARLLEVAKRRLEAGDIAPLNLRLVEAEHARAAVAAIDAEQRYRAARLRLARRSGWPVASLPSPAGELDDPREAPPLHTLLEVARRGQPALATRRRALIQAQAGLALARREAWPKPTLGLRVDREGSADGAGETALRGTLTLPLPLFHTNQEVRARARVEVGIEQAALTAAEQVLEARLSRLAGDVDAAAASLIAYGATVVPKLEENLKMLQRAYELGEVDVLQLSVARERFLGVQNDSLDAYADYFSAVAELEEAVGADLWPEERSDHTKGEESRNE